MKHIHAFYLAIIAALIITLTARPVYAASLTLTVPNPRVAEIVAAVALGFPRNQGETDAQFMTRAIFDDYLRPRVDLYRRRQATLTAIPTAPGELGTGN